MKRLGIGAALLVAFAIGFGLGRSPAGDRLRDAGEKAIGSVVVASAGEMATDPTTRIILENPSLLPAILGGGAFGNESDPAIARRIFSKDEAAIAAAHDITKIEAVAPRT